MSLDVQRASLHPNVTIYRVEVWGVATDAFGPSRRWGAREAIAQCAEGRVVEQTAHVVDEGVIKSDIWGFTVRGFDPDSSTGLQARVRR